MIEPGQFGVVRIVRGTHRGCIVYYDDDEGKRAIVYFGSPAEEKATYTLLGYGSLVEATQDEKIMFEMEHLASIDPALREHMGLHP